jgi:hypothetical protein
MDPVDIGRFASPVLHGCGLCWKINVAAFASRIVLVFLSPRSLPLPSSSCSHCCIALLKVCYMRVTHGTDSGFAILAGIG